MAASAGSAAGEAELARAFVEPRGKEGIVEWHGRERRREAGQ